jgi:hypothetical protein
MSRRVHVDEPGPLGIHGYGRVIEEGPAVVLVVLDDGASYRVLIQFTEDAERYDEREALRREDRQAAMLDAGPILAEHRRLKGE